VKDVLDIWKTVEDTVNIVPGLKAALEGFLDSNPEFNIAIEGLTVIYNINTGKGQTLEHNLSDDMSNLVHGLETADWTRAMAGLGGVIHDIDACKGLLDYSMTQAHNNEEAKPNQAEAPAPAAAAGAQAEAQPAQQLFLAY